MREEVLEKRRTLKDSTEKEGIGSRNEEDVKRIHREEENMLWKREKFRKRI